MTADDAHALTPSGPQLPSAPPDVIRLLDKALEAKVDVGTIERLVDLHYRVADRQAVEAFNQALASLQAEVEPILADKVSEQVSGHGMGKRIPYASHTQVMQTVRPFLVKHGFSITHDEEESDGRKRVTAILRHTLGHEQRATFSCPIESRAGMSSQQKAVSANSYGRRVTTVMVLNLTTADPDTNGVDEADLEPASQEQRDEIEREVEETGADRPRFLAYLKLDKAEDMTVGHYRKAKAALAQKRRGRKAAQ